MKPTIGRMVHIEMYGETYPAMVIKVHNPTCVNLQVFLGTNTEYLTSVLEGTGEGQWHWPPRDAYKGEGTEEVPNPFSLPLPEGYDNSDHCR